MAMTRKRKADPLENNLRKRNKEDDGGNPPPQPAQQPPQPQPVVFNPNGAVDRVDWTASHALTAQGGDARINPVWTTGAADHAAAYTRATNPTVDASITLGQAPAQGVGNIQARARVGGNVLAAGNANVAGAVVTAQLVLNGLANAASFGQQDYTLVWEISNDGNAWHNMGQSGQHHIYWLVGNPIGTLHSGAVDRVTGFAGNDNDPATAIRIGIHGNNPYNPALVLDGGTAADAITGGTALVCGSMANVMLAAAQLVGIAGSVVVYWGGLPPVQGRSIWISHVGSPNTIDQVQPGGHTFTYHAVAAVGGVEHDAALNRIGVQAHAIAAGANIRFLDIAGLAIPAGQVGQAYDHTLQAAQQQVALNHLNVGGPLTNNFFTGIALSIPQGANAFDYQAIWTSVPQPPAGLTLTPAGRLHGTPTGPGTTNLSLRAGANLNIFNDRNVNMTINP